jgi:phosphoribosylamine---glycine ligase
VIEVDDKTLYPPWNSHDPLFVTRYSPRPSMNLLLIGSGGREHALAWKIAQSPRLSRLFIAPGNPGTARHGENVALDVSNPVEVIAFCRTKKIALVVIGPELPLVAGLVDALEQAGIAAFGPSKAAAKLEGSKGFTKDLCARFDIPTAAYRRFDTHDAAKAYIRERGAPIVIKADGLAAGKGVVVAATLDEALAALDALFIGHAAVQIVVEDCLEGPESSFFALCDGETAIPFGTARDYKRAFDGDAGPNTGGMGALSPSPFLTPALEEEVMTRIIRPTLRGMVEMGMPYRGILYAGLMLTKEGPKLIEYNCRFGDPETQVLMPRYAGDIIEAFLAAVEGRLATLTPLWHIKTAVTVVMATRGYPGEHLKGSVISGLESAEAAHALVFQAGTTLRDNTLTASGGRVLAVTGLAPSYAAARHIAYSGTEAINWPEGFCRSDIGQGV